MSLQDKIDDLVKQIFNETDLNRAQMLRQKIRKVLDDHDPDRCYVRGTMFAGPMKAEILYFKDIVTGEPGPDIIRTYWNGKLQHELGVEQVKLMVHLLEISGGHNFKDIELIGVKKIDHGPEGAPLFKPEEGEGK